MKKIAALCLFITSVYGCNKSSDLNTTSGNTKDAKSDVLKFTRDTISLFKNIPVYGIYRYPVVDDTLPNGIIRLSNPAVARHINITSAMQNYTKGLQLVLTLYAQEDDYDRLGYVYFSDKKPVADGPDQSILTNRGLEVMRIITPFFLSTSNPNKLTYALDVTDITDIIPLFKKDIWVAVQIDNNPEYRIQDKAGFLFSLDLVKSSTTPLTSYLQNIFKTSMTQKIYQDTFITTKNLTDAEINIYTSGHGSASGGEEYAHRVHNIYIDGVLKYTFNPQKDCAPYRKYSPRGNPFIFIGNNTYNPRNWCPGEVLPHNYVYLGNLAAGNHTIRVEIPDADFGSPGDNIIVSAYLTGN